MSGSHEESPEHDESIASILSLLIIFSLLAIFSQYFVVFMGKFRINIPHSLILYLIGICVGLLNFAPYIDQGNLFVVGLKKFTNIDGHIIFLVLLPPILYEAAANMSFHIIRKVLLPSVLLAIPGVLLNIGLVTLFLYYVLGLSWLVAGIGGSILSATDPVAVVSALASLGAPAPLTHLIEGESLLNDGSAVIVFTVLAVFLGIDDKCLPEVTGGLACIWRLTFTLAILAPLFGILMAFLLVVALRVICRFLGTRFSVLEVMLVVFFIFTTFFVAEKAQISGVLATVSLGGAMSYWSHQEFLTNESFIAQHTVVEWLAYFNNGLIFQISGVLSVRLLRDLSWHNLGCGIGLYAFLHLTRFLINLGLFPILRKVGYGFRFRELLFVTFAGLRGAVGLALVLLFGKTARESVPHLEDEVEIVEMMVTLVVLFTLAINGPLTESLYNFLQIQAENPIEHVELHRQMAKLDDVYIQRGGGYCRMLGDLYQSQSGPLHILEVLPEFKSMHKRFRGLSSEFELRESIFDVVENLDVYNWKGRASRLGSRKNEITSDEWQLANRAVFDKIAGILTEMAEDKYGSTHTLVPPILTTLSVDINEYSLLIHTTYRILTNEFKKDSKNGLINMSVWTRLQDACDVLMDHEQIQTHTYKTNPTDFDPYSPVTQYFKVILEWLREPVHSPIIDLYGLSYRKVYFKVQAAYAYIRVTKILIAEHRSLDFSGITDLLKDQLQNMTNVLLPTIEELYSRRSYLAIKVNLLKFLWARKTALVHEFVASGHLSHKHAVTLEDEILHKVSRDLERFIPRRKEESQLRFLLAKFLLFFRLN